MDIHYSANGTTKTNGKESEIADEAEAQRDRQMKAGRNDDVKRTLRIRLRDSLTRFLS